MSRRHISTTARSKLFLAKGGICHLCGGKVQVGQAWDVSHVIPLAIGGPDDATNWDVAHRKCHRAHTSARTFVARVSRVPASPKHRPNEPHPAL
jgi:5-methylcytosine-specific restriction protein A